MRHFRNHMGKMQRMMPQPRTFIMLLTTLVMMNPLVARGETDSLLTQHEKYIITIASYTAKPDLGRLKEVIAEALQSGLTVNQIKEVQVHLYAYCGFPRSIRGLQTLMQVLEERRAKGINDVAGPDAGPIDDTLSKYDRGRNTLGRLTNLRQERPRSGYGAFAPIIDTFLKEHLFADIFDRDVLTYSEREWVTISVLSAIGSAEPMLKSHFGICLNLGIKPSKLYDFTRTVDALSGHEASVSAKKVLDELMDEARHPKR